MSKGKLKTRYIVMSMQGYKMCWQPMRVFKHRSAAEDFKNISEGRTIWTYSYWTGKHYE